MLIGSRPLPIYLAACLTLGFHMLAIGFLGHLVTAQNNRREHKHSIAEVTPPGQENVR